MKDKSVIIILLLFLSCLMADAAPARKGCMGLIQPDGSSFQALIRGDEFNKITTTADGKAIIRESDGWWCYAFYDKEGRKHSSGYKVGKDTPKEILTASRNIPYERLATLAGLKREKATVQGGAKSIKRLLEEKRMQTKSEAAVTKHGLVILAAFTDVGFTYDKNDFERMLMEEGYSVNGATGSAKEYFDAQFKGQVSFEFHVTDIVTLPNKMAYYGGNDSNGDDTAPAKMVTDACEAVKDQFDFSLFDDDGDRVVDNIFIIFAGLDEAEYGGDDCIWSHSWYVASGAGIHFTVDNMLIDRYACTSEMRNTGRKPNPICGIGTFCHEFAHTLGLPDFYDTDYESTGGMAAGLWCSTSLMDSGNQNNNGHTPPYFNAIERELLGLSEPDTLTKSKTYTLEPVHLNGQAYKIPTETPGEYFLLECREETGWDEHIGGSGMLVYHIDRSNKVLQKWDLYNTVNTNPSHQNADLIEADSRVDRFAYAQDFSNAIENIRGIFFPYGNVTSITAEGKPGFSSWYGASGHCSISGISREGGSIKFNFIGTEEHDTPPYATNIRIEAFADAAIIRFDSSSEYEGEATVKWYRPDKEAESASVSPYSPGKYALTIKNLEPTGKTYKVDIHFTIDGLDGQTSSKSFMTKSKPSVKWPYIYLNSVERNSDGSFPEGTRIPLWIYNAADATEIRWYFNESEITHDGDGYYTLPGHGSLKAEVYREDGNMDVLYKKIYIGESSL